MNLAIRVSDGAPDFGLQQSEATTTVEPAVELAGRRKLEAPERAIEVYPVNPITVSQAAMIVGVIVGVRNPATVADGVPTEVDKAPGDGPLRPISRQFLAHAEPPSERIHVIGLPGISIGAPIVIPVRVVAVVMGRADSALEIPRVG